MRIFRLNFSEFFICNPRGLRSESIAVTLILRPPFVSFGCVPAALGNPLYVRIRNPVRITWRTWIFLLWCCGLPFRCCHLCDSLCDSVLRPPGSPRHVWLFTTNSLSLCSPFPSSQILMGLTLESAPVPFHFLPLPHVLSLRFHFRLGMMAIPSVHPFDPPRIFTTPEPPLPQQSFLP